MGGGTAGGPGGVRGDGGLSPRGRGNQLFHLAPGPCDGSIPAWAGEPVSPRTSCSPLAVYPRVGGGTSRMDRMRRHDDGLSPRGRGNRVRRPDRMAGNRSIPAWAGEPAVAPCTAPMPRVYPRVGGGTSGWQWESYPRWGLSPRGRGNHTAAATKSAVARSIPAWAGEPMRARALIPKSSVYPRVGGGTE